MSSILDPSTMNGIPFRSFPCRRREDVSLVQMRKPVDDTHEMQGHGDKASEPFQAFILQLQRGASDMMVVGRLQVMDKAMTSLDFSSSTLAGHDTPEIGSEWLVP